MITPENPDWKKASDELPVYSRNQAIVLIKTAGENISISIQYIVLPFSEKVNPKIKNK